MSALSLTVLAACVLANVASVAALVKGWNAERPVLYAARAAIASVLVVTMGFVGTVLGLRSAFGAVAHVTPEHKATLLAQGISEAMNATAFGLVAAVLPCAIAIALLFRRARPPMDAARSAT